MLADGDLAIIVEYCNKGALVDALYGAKTRDLSPSQLLSIARGAAAGVDHLHRQGIVHRDLAARNVLLSGNELIPKVCDFGMAREIDEDAHENQTKQEIGPVRWMAPEQMDAHVYSKATDVYAFGVVLYEIFAKEMPWQGVKNVKVLLNVSTGKHMTPPDSTPDAVRDLMLDCWQMQPAARPSMSDVQRRLRSEMDESEGDSM